MECGPGYALMLFLLLFGVQVELRSPEVADKAAAAHKKPHEDVLNLRPLIGIVSETGSPSSANHTYIAASYVRFIQAAGARVVPIQCDLPPAELARRFEKVNGVLIPGGGQILEPGHPFYDTTAQLLDLAKKANDCGDFFPVHATCLGFETLAVIVSRNTSILSAFDGEDQPSTLQLAPGGNASRFWRSLPKRVQRNMQRKRYTMENHSNGLAPVAFRGSNQLRDFFRVITTSKDWQGRTFISTMEAKKYPVSATQWHPEKNAFEWNRRTHIPHEPGAVDVTLAVAKAFVSQARRNFHKPADEVEEDELLIYNWPVTFTGKYDPKTGSEGYFDEAYCFPSTKAGGPLQLPTTAGALADT